MCSRGALCAFFRRCHPRSAASSHARRFSFPSFPRSPSSCVSDHSSGFVAPRSHVCDASLPRTWLVLRVLRPPMGSSTFVLILPLVCETLFFSSLFTFGRPRPSSDPTPPHTHTLGAARPRLLCPSREKGGVSSVPRAARKSGRQGERDHAETRRPSPQNERKRGGVQDEANTSTHGDRSRSTWPSPSLVTYAWVKKCQTWLSSLDEWSSMDGNPSVAACTMGRCSANRLRMPEQIFRRQQTRSSVHSGWLNHLAPLIISCNDLVTFTFKTTITSKHFVIRIYVLLVTFNIRKLITTLQVVGDGLDQWLIVPR